ncbi:DUF2059 domain-containing protein [Halioxenophilus sp. WMMB6]|uniref:DUF2059 domain-containing protein n=1 Tax=Halioxenophilus sp. WMMB6 TaxID=3073815 RepID=UPI00295EF132|nr:DUF2059 domain-containing protein [Halioxenophilus sp. WMMB6]
MNRIALLLLALALPCAVTAEPSKRESVEELMSLTKVDSMVDSIYSQMDKMLINMSQQMGIQPSEQAVFDNFMRKVAAAMRQEMSWEVMKEPMINIYLKTYTEQEIQDMLVFYQSETGKSLVAKMPAVMTESITLSQQMMSNFMPTLRELSAEFATEIEAGRAQNQ